MGFENSPSDHETWSIRCHVGIHVDFHIHRAFTHCVGPSSVVWSELRPALPFPPMRVLEVQWRRGLSVSCVKSPLLPYPCLQRAWLLKLIWYCSVSSRYRKEGWERYPLMAESKNWSFVLFVRDVPNLATLEMLRPLNKTSKSSPTHRTVLAYIIHIYPTQVDSQFADPRLWKELKRKMRVPRFEEVASYGHNISTRTAKVWVKPELLPD